MALLGVNDKLVQILGRLHYRTSYGQNVLQHSMEVALIAETIADELGANSQVAKRGGLFHDIGKALDQRNGAQGVIVAHVTRYALNYLRKRYPGNEEAVELMVEGIDEEEKRGTMDAGLLLASALSRVEYRRWYDNGGKIYLQRCAGMRGEYRRIRRWAQRTMDSKGAVYAVRLFEGPLWKRIRGHVAHFLGFRDTPPQTVEWYLQELARSRKK